MGILISPRDAAVESRTASAVSMVGIYALNQGACRLIACRCIQSAHDMSFKIGWASRCVNECFMIEVFSGTATLC